MLRFQEEAISGLLTIYPSAFKDERGYFMETFKDENYAAILPGVRFVQDNISCSSKGTLRGLHFQAPPFDQGKLIQVLQGSVLDVAVDLRKNSATYGQHIKLVLSAELPVQFYIPPGFAHGFMSLEDNTLFSYKCTNVYSKAHEACLHFADPTLNIHWGEGGISPIVSEKDQLGQAFARFQSPF
ncbi:MAG: hypothetical protein RLZZ301_326 [Bacteroidota bacterium]|jgi:dTDP-4-dehydrorhamnose 3,5-epimerase